MAAANPITVSFTPQSLVEHFRNRDKLKIPKGWFEIKGLEEISALIEKYPDAPNRSENQKCFYIFDRILAVLGKRVARCKGIEQFSGCKITAGRLFAKVDEDSVLRVKRSPIDIHPAQLFGIMKLLSIQSIVFGPGQPLRFRGFIDRQPGETNRDRNLYLWVEYLPVDQLIRWTPVDKLKDTVGFTLSYGEQGKPVKTVALEADEGFTLSVESDGLTDERYAELTAAAQQSPQQ
jgi:hypothetical protein